MRILFSAHGARLRLFDAVLSELGKHERIERAGFAVADSAFYSSFVKEHPSFEKSGHIILKEWVMIAQRASKVNYGRLATCEAALNSPAGLFGAIVADRRLIMGPDCAYSQDYRRRFTDNELLSILDIATTEMEQLFEALRPDIVVTFVCVTLFDYLAYLFARARKVRFLNLRPMRVGDRIFAGVGLNDPDRFLVEAYRRGLAGTSACVAEARPFIRRVREQHGRYEGVVRPSASPARQVGSNLRALPRSILNVLRSWRQYSAGEARNDNHVPHPLRSLAFAALVNPYRARQAARVLGNSYAIPEDLAEQRYAFYPLHTEPEVSQLVYGRPYLNQIEVVRMIAISLPVDMVLVVKEHPWMVGKRSLGYYRKLLEIPRVRLAPPELETRPLVAGASLIVVIAGSAGLEAAILGKPVVSFGDCPFNLLPDTMVRRCADPRRLPELIGDLLTLAKSDERALEAYVSAVFETSVGVHFYSTLLRRQDVHTEREASFEEEVARLAEYLRKRMTAPLIVDAPSDPAIASW